MNPSPKHHLSPASRNGQHAGWVKRVNGTLKWICSAKVAPHGAAADDYYEKNFTDLWQAKPPGPGTAVDIATVADHFIDRKRRAGIDPRSLNEYIDAAQDFCDVVGEDRRPAELVPGDFAKVRAKWEHRFGPDRLSKFVVMIRSMFKWARKPPLRLPDPDYGDEFNVAGKRAVKLDRAARRQTHGVKLFDADAVAALLKKANPTMAAMILLSLNGGLGNTDLAEMPLSVIDLDGGWIDYARGKTGEERRFPLWPQTIKAIRAALKVRADRFGRWRKIRKTIPDDVAVLAFVTRQGRPYIVDTMSKSTPPRPLHKDRIATTFATLCKTAGQTQHGRGFYSLRRTFRTIADEVGDQRAAAFLMGHEVSDMGGVYVQRISDERIKAVTDHVHAKLFSVARSKRAPAADRRTKRGGAGAKARKSPTHHA